MSANEIPAGARQQLDAWHEADRTIVFTNGVFDILHRGHVEYLEEARALGDHLVIGLNSDASVQRIKGPTRPFVPEHERRELLEALECVDLVILFDEDTPERIIREVRPRVLVKGADWAADAIVGADFVESLGGRVERIAVREGLSTTAIVERIVRGESGA